MATEQIKTLARRYFDALDRQDLDSAIAMYAPGIKFYGLAPMPLDATGVRHAMSAFYMAFPDSRMPIEEMVAEGNTVAVRHTFRGTHQAPFQGVPASQNTIVVPSTVTLHFENDKIVEAWLNADMLGLLIQIGAIPQPTGL